MRETAGARSSASVSDNQGNSCGPFICPRWKSCRKCLVLRLTASCDWATTVRCSRRKSLLRLWKAGSSSRCRQRRKCCRRNPDGYGLSWKGAFGMLLWIVFGTVALVVCLLLSMKIGVRVVYDAAQLRVWLQLGPAMLQVYPEKNTKSPMWIKKWKRAKKDDAGSGDGENAETEDHRRGGSFAAERTASAISGCAGARAAGIRVRCLSLHLVISDPNPAEAARRYGMVNSVLWPLWLYLKILFLWSAGRCRSSWILARGKAGARRSFPHDAAAPRRGCRFGRWAEMSQASASVLERNKTGKDSTTEAGKSSFRIKTDAA